VYNMYVFRRIIIVNVCTSNKLFVVQTYLHEHATGSGRITALAMLLLGSQKIVLRQGLIGLNHRLSINRPTKRGKQKSPSDGHWQCEKEMDDHLVACQ
jgi:hypothetical protein